MSALEEIVSPPADVTHQVQFYDDREFPADCIAEFLAPALERDAVLVLATREHYLAIEDALERRNLDIARALSEGRLIHCDARRTLDELNNSGEPDRAAFQSVVEKLLAVFANQTRIRVYGEMVDLLCEQGKRDAAIVLEQVWNEAIAQRDVAVLCGYALSRFDDEAEAFSQICTAHSQVMPAPDAMVLEADNGRLRAELQQVVRALSREAKRRKKYEATAQRASSHLTKLHQVTTALLEPLSLADVARVITTDTMHILGAEESLVAVVENDGKTLRVLARVGPRALEKIAAKTFQSGRPIYLVETETSESIVCHPLGTSARHFGVVCFGFSSPRRFATDERVLLDDVSKQLALAIERAKLHDEARTNHALLEGIIASATDAIITADATRRIILFNGAAERMFGCKAQQLAGAPLDRFLPLDSFEGLEPGRLETLMATRADGSEFSVEIATNRIELSGESFSSIIVRDITERQRAEEVLRETNRRKDEFLAILGHELRNPLAPIMTALQLMKLRGDVSSEKERSVIERQVRHVSRLVDDLLDVSRISTGKIDLKRERVDVSWLIARSIEMTRPLIEQRGHRLSVELSHEALVFEADRVRMAQALANLLTNAAKYTDPGGEITVSAKKRGNWVQISVKDSGVGLRPEMMEQIFQPFVQVNRTLERSQGGIGLGLWLVKNLVELHRGRISVKSDGLGWGSEFIIEVPAGIQVREPSNVVPYREQASLTSRRILIVDDNPDAAETLADLMRAVGHAVAVVNDAPQALELADEEQFDIAILDIGLPIMDGHELAKRLRDKTKSPLRFVAVTGYGTEEDRAKSRAAGFEAHFVKPFDHHALLSTIETLVGAGHTS